MLKVANDFDSRETFTRPTRVTRFSDINQALLFTLLYLTNLTFKTIRQSATEILYGVKKSDFRRAKSLHGKEIIFIHRNYDNNAKLFKAQKFIYVT